MFVVRGCSICAALPAKKPASRKKDFNRIRKERKGFSTGTLFLSLIRRQKFPTFEKTKLK
jgi:hypothetical protein